MYMEHSVPDNFQNQRVNEEFWGVNSSGSLQIFLSLPFILWGQQARILKFLTWDPALIWNTRTVKLINEIGYVFLLCGTEIWFCKTLILTALLERHKTTVHSILFFLTNLEKVSELLLFLWVSRL